MRVLRKDTKPTNEEHSTQTLGWLGPSMGWDTWSLKGAGA